MREELIAAALRLFSEGGVDAISMRAVAALVGVSAMAPYRYFADKGDLLGDLWQYVLREVYECVAKAVAPNMSARQREHAANDALFRYWETHPDEYRLVYQTQGTPQTRENMAPVYKDIMQLFSGLTAGIAEEIGVDLTHAQLADEVRMAMGLGYLSALSNRRYPWRDLPALRAVYIEQIVATVERCLRDGPRGATKASTANKRRRKPTPASPQQPAASTSERDSLRGRSGTRSDGLEQAARSGIRSSA